MFRATLYIIVCTARNRLRRRLQRLREPRYAVGATAGLAYLFGTLFMRRRAFGTDSPQRRRRAARYSAMVPAFGAAGVTTGGLLLAVAAALSWFLPFGSGLLSFSKAETALLFPAPVTRRDLLVYRLMRSQLAVFTGALIFAVAYPTGSVLARVRGMFGAWLLLMVTHVFFTGVTLARARLRQPQGAAGSRAFIWIGLAVSLSGVTALVVGMALELARTPIPTVGRAFALLMDIANQPVVRVLLAPFTAVIRPVFAQSSSEFAWTAAGALLVYAVAILWVMWADQSFDLVADEVVEAQAREPRPGRTMYAPRQVAWRLAPTGRAEAAFIWKGSLQTFRVVDRRVLLRVGLGLAWLTLTAAVFVRARGLAQALGVAAAVGASFTIFMAPQFLRIDLRQDLQHLELLKSWPLRGADVVRGEIAWPAAVVTIVAWALGAIALSLSAVAFDQAGGELRTAIGWSLMVLAPGIVAGQYAVHNATVLLFPAWIPLGAGRPRGVDAMGQRVILLGATWVMLSIALLPGAGSAALLWWLFGHAIGPWVLVPAALIGTCAMGVQVMMATSALGQVFDRLDLSSVERPES